MKVIIRGRPTREISIIMTTISSGSVDYNLMPKQNFTTIITTLMMVIN